MFARILCFLIVFAMSVISVAISFQGVSRGYISPWRMQRWKKPDDIYQDDRPFAFWFTFSAYLGIGILTFFYALKECV